MPLHRPVGSSRLARGNDKSVNLAIALVAALLLIGCGTADKDASSDSRPDDAGLIVFTNYSEGSGAYYAVRPDGTGLRKLKLDPDELALSADGRFMATQVTSFERDKVFGHHLVFVSRLDGSERRRVPLPEGDVGAPSLSPDGSRLALIYTDDPFGGPWDVATVSVEGGDFTTLTSSGGVEDVQWSPDGNELVFTDRPRDAEGMLDEIAAIYVVRADGDDVRQLARGEDPAWSPDGEQIAFSDRDFNISVVDAGGGEPDIVVPNGGSPIWSPSGERLAFLRTIDCGHATCTSGLFVADAEGGSARRVGPTLFEPTLVAWTIADLAPA
jgi:Tol biopolymer transport system component